MDVLPVSPGFSRFAMDSLANVRADTNRSLFQNTRVANAHRYAFAASYGWLEPAQWLDLRGFLFSKGVQGEAFEIALPFPYDRSALGQNLLDSSEAIDAAQWTQIGTPVITPNSQTAPDGTLTADTIEDTSATAFSHVAQVIAKDRTDRRAYTASIFLRKQASQGSNFDLRLQFNGITAAAYDIIVSSVTGESRPNVLSTEQNLQVIDFDANWWRASVRAVPPDDTSTSISIAVFPAVTDGGDFLDPISVIGQGSQSVWGMQLEVGPSPTRYFPWAAPLPTIAYAIGDTVIQAQGFTAKLDQVALETGDLIRFGAHVPIYTLTEPVVTDALGDATLNVFPPLATAIDNTDAIQVARRAQVTIAESSLLRLDRNQQAARGLAANFYEAY